MESILIDIIFIMAVFFVGFIIGIMSFQAIPDDKDSRKEYCFECEIEMPVKEKNGRLYCSNCGLYH